MRCTVKVCVLYCRILCTERVFGCLGSLHGIAASHAQTMTAFKEKAVLEPQIRCKLASHTKDHLFSAAFVCVREVFHHYVSFVIVRLTNILSIFFILPLYIDKFPRRSQFILTRIMNETVKKYQFQPVKTLYNAFKSYYSSYKQDLKECQENMINILIRFV